MKKYLGIAALVVGIIGALICLASAGGIVFLVIGVIIACIDIYLGFKEEKLTFQEYLQIAQKEKTLSVITIIAIVIFAFFLPEIFAMSSF